jgi:hypothetical protein
VEIGNPLKDQTGKVGELTGKVTELKDISNEQINKIKSMDELQHVQQSVGKVSDITDKAQAYTTDAKNIVNGNIGEVKELPKTLENQVAKLDDVQGIQKEMGEFGQYSEMAGKAGDPEALKKEAIKQATTMAVDHFAGQQEALKGTMDKVRGMKAKYSKLGSLKDIPKRMPNPMKGKPLIERIVPAITFQIQKTDDVLFDYNPSVGYCFTGRFTAGAGWNERVNISKHVTFTLDDRVYGPRIFADFKFKRGFSIRTDIEKMNTYVPAMTANGLSAGDGQRAWMWSAFIGFKKEYKVSKKVKGNFQAMYNLYDDHYNSPYADRFVTRFGFEFPMKKKAKGTQGK